MARFTSISKIIFSLLVAIILVAVSLPLNNGAQAQSGVSLDTDYSTYEVGETVYFIINAPDYPNTELFWSSWHDTGSGLESTGETNAGYRDFTNSAGFRKLPSGSSLTTGDVGTWRKEVLIGVGGPRASVTYEVVGVGGGGGGPGPNPNPTANTGDDKYFMCDTTAVTGGSLSASGVSAGNVQANGVSSCPASGWSWYRCVENCNISGSCLYATDCPNQVACLIDAAVGCACEGQGSPLGDYPCCQQTINNSSFATRNTAEALAKCLGGSVGTTQLNYPYRWSQPMYQIEFPTGESLIAGTLADCYRRFSRSYCDDRVLSQVSSGGHQVGNDGGNDGFGGGSGGGFDGPGSGGGPGHGGGSSSSQQVGCLNPAYNPWPSGWVRPCPAFEVLPSRSSGGSVSISVKPTPGISYFWKDIWYTLFNPSTGTFGNWQSLTLPGALTAGEYISSNSTLTVPATTFSQPGQYFIVAWDWSWSDARNCYVGPDGVCDDQSQKFRLQTYIKE